MKGIMAGIVHAVIMAYRYTSMQQRLFFLLKKKILL